jgi:hypothetical protein
MPASDVARKLLEFLKKAPTANPKLTGGALGAVSGGAAGGLFSEEGATTRGVLQGALLGSGAGLGVGALRELPLVAGSLAAAIPVGWAARRKLSPLRAEELREQREEAKRKRLKEEGGQNQQAESSKPGELEAQAAYNTGYKETALMSAQTNLKFIKQALQPDDAQMEKAAEQLMAFDVGMDIFCENNGITKAALADAYGLTEQELAVKTLAVLQAQAEQVD